MRVFLSIDIDDDALLARISRIQSKLDSKAAKLKLVEKDNIHFTLRFFGDTPVLRIDEMRKALGTLQFPPFTIQVEGIGAFPNPRRPNVIWIGVSQNAQQMTDLKGRIDAQLANLGYPPEKGFKAHATIARVRAVNDRDGMVRSLELLARESAGTMTVSSFQMTKSTLTSPGPIYETLWEIPEKR